MAPAGKPKKSVTSSGHFTFSLQYTNGYNPDTEKKSDRTFGIGIKVKI
jgi:hypothetical protein